MRLDFNSDLLIKTGLSANQFLLLLYLEQKKFNYKNIETTVGLTEKTITRAIKVLVQEGYVERISMGNYQFTNKLAEL